MDGFLPRQKMPYIWGDFNACGWAGNGDQSIYALDRDALAAIPATEGMLAFVWADDEAGTILGCVAVLQQVTIGSFSGWRAEPVQKSFYRGPKPAHLIVGLVLN
jgi:hypothetical protein